MPELTPVGFARFGGSLRLFSAEENLRDDHEDWSILTNADLGRIAGAVATTFGETSIYTTGLANGNLHSMHKRFGSNRYQGVGTILYRDQVSILTGLSGNDLAMVDYNDGKANAYTFITDGVLQRKDDGTTLSQMGITAPAVTPGVATGSGTGLTGVYKVRFTYRNSSSGAESNPSTASVASANLSDDDLDISGMTASADAQVDKIRVYRTLSGGSVYFFDQEINNGTTTATSSQADADLGAQLETDNALVPSTTRYFAGPIFNRLFGAPGSQANLLHWSKPFESGFSRAEQWSATDFLEVGSTSETIQNVIAWSVAMFVPTKDSWWILQGSTSESFFPQLTRAQRGLAASYGYAITTQGIFFVAEDGLRVFNGQVDELVFRELRPIFEGRTVNGYNPMNLDQIARCRMAFFNGHIYFAYPSTGAIVPDTLVKIDIENKNFQIIDRQIGSLLSEEDGKQLVRGDQSGIQYQMETGHTLSDAAISFIWKTKPKQLQARKLQCMAIHLDIDTSGQDITFAFMVNGSTKHTITVNTSAREDVDFRLPEGIFGERIQFQFSGSVTDEVVLYNTLCMCLPGEILNVA